MSCIYIKYICMLILHVMHIYVMNIHFMHIHDIRIYDMYSKLSFIYIYIYIYNVALTMLCKIFNMRYFQSILAYYLTILGWHHMKIK